MNIVEETTRHLVNRWDAYGVYKDGKQWTEKNGGLTEELIAAHFAGTAIIGLHTTAADQTCKWCCWDFDSHDEGDGDNWDHVTALAENLELQGMHPIIEDSNGAGGYHVWIIFNEPLPCPAVFDWQRAVPVGGKVEHFPKQRTAARYGNFVRLPGKHPKRDHWSRFWDGAAWVNDLVDVWEVTDATLVEVREEHTAPPAAVASGSLDRLVEHVEKTDYENFMEACELLKTLRHQTVEQYEGWIKIGMILHRYNPTGLGLHVWDSWSRKSPKYQPGVCEAKWGTFTAPEKGLGIGTLRLWAAESAAELPYGANNDSILESISSSLGFPVEGFKKLGNEAGQVSFYLETGGKPVRLGGGAVILTASKFRCAVYEALAIDIPTYDAAAWKGIVRQLTQVCEAMTIDEDTIVGNFRDMLSEYRNDKKTPTFPDELDEENRQAFTRVIRNKEPFIQRGLFHLSMTGFKRWLSINQIPPLVEPHKTLRLCHWHSVNIVSNKIGRRYYAAGLDNPLLE